MPTARLDSRALVRVSGPDWRSFLQGLLTQDVETLRPGELRFGALLAPQGRLLFDLFILGGADEALLDVAADRRDDLIRRLTIYRLRAKVDIAADERSVFAAWGEAASDGAPDPRLAALGRRIYGDATADAGEDAFETHRLFLGAPDPARDAVPDRSYPMEANFDLLNGIDFRKGCFVGQETTSRMKRRGNIKKRMLPVVFDGPAPAPGTEILAGDLLAGEVLTGREGRAMALLRLDRIGDGPLTVEGRPVRVEQPAWMATRKTD